MSNTMDIYDTLIADAIKARNSGVSLEGIECAARSVYSPQFADVKEWPEPEPEQERKAVMSTETNLFAVRLHLNAALAVLKGDGAISEYAWPIGNGPPTKPHPKQPILDTALPIGREIAAAHAAAALEAAPSDVPPLAARIMEASKILNRDRYGDDDRREAWRKLTAVNDICLAALAMAGIKAAP